MRASLPLALAVSLPSIQKTGQTERQVPHRTHLFSSSLRRLSPLIELDRLIRLFSLFLFGLREYLAGVQYPVRVKGLLYPLHQFDGRRAELHAEVFGLRDADPVLAGDSPLEPQRKLEYLGHGGLGLPCLRRVTPVVHDVYVDIAVAGVAEAGDEQAPLLGYR